MATITECIGELPTRIHMINTEQSELQRTKKREE